MSEIRSFPVFPGLACMSSFGDIPGFLKKWFFLNGFIDQLTYNSDHFRIGKSLNPSLPRRFQRRDYVYSKIVSHCPNQNLGDQLWDAWKQCRNLVVHYFPHHQHCLSLKNARQRINQLSKAMADAIELNPK